MLMNFSWIDLGKTESYFKAQTRSLDSNKCRNLFCSGHMTDPFSFRPANIAVMRARGRFFAPQMLPDFYFRQEKGRWLSSPG